MYDSCPFFPATAVATAAPAATANGINGNGIQIVPFMRNFSYKINIIKILRYYQGILQIFWKKSVILG
ncbi:hypothetical protein BCE_0837 [Bacillus cereus ATCC 10987]|uniref:Uncharacterized protein n=1 Tax=Bacillus cereus (strain ATCC 10987 / NRS 248) TaxID=222523 RepID=Q73D77_BACC1|nr:hypothetical protein BCE_0837 [Bacillus cereus ATCC 10987]